MNRASGRELRVRERVSEQAGIKKGLGIRDQRSAGKHFPNPCCLLPNPVGSSAGSLAIALLTTIVLLLLLPASAMAQREIDRQIDALMQKKRKARPNPVFVGLNLGWSGTYRPGRWVPLQLFIDPADKPVGGVLTLDLPQDSFHRMVLEQDYALTPGSQLQMVLYGQLGTTDEVYLTLLDQDGRPRLRERRDYNSLLPNSVGQSRVVGVVGERATIEATGRPDAPPRSGGVEDQRWIARWEAEARLPRQWVGYDVLDCLVLANPNWSLISPEAGAAIVEWVRRGGCLLLYDIEPPPADHPLRQLLPLEIDEPRRTEISRAAVARIGAGYTMATSAVVSGLKLRPSAMGWQHLTDGAVSYLAGGSADFGWVNYLSTHPTDLVVGRVDPARERGADLGEAKRFVADLIERTLDRTLVEPVPLTSLIGPNQRVQRTGAVYYGYGGMDEPGEMAASSVLNVLSQIPGIGPISFLWIGGLLTALLVLLGPVDYFALRRLGRLPWTWYTVTAYIVFFSGIGFAIAHTRRLGTTQVRRASVVDWVAPGTRAYQTGMTVVYASHSGSYEPVDSEADRWWSAYLPTSQFGSRRSQSGTHEVYYRQSAGSAISRLPIPVANFRCLRDQSTVEPVDIRLTRRDDGGGYELTNHGKTPLLRAQIFRFDGNQIRVRNVGRVAPGSSIAIDEPRQPVSDSHPIVQSLNPEQFYTGFSYGDEPPDTPNVPRHALARVSDAYSRTDGVFVWLRAGAVLLWAESEPPVEFTLKDESTKDYNLRLYRIVFPREVLDDAPGADVSPVATPAVSESRKDTLP